jgi:hypothetical protein
MSFSSNFVLPRIAVGSEPENVADAQRLRSMGITHVLDVRMPNDMGHDTTGAPNLYRGLGITYHRTPMVDDGTQKPPSTYVDGVRFIGNALSRPGTKVYVHCAAGMYRSPSMVYAALRAMGYGQDAAWDRITSTRTVALPQYIPGAEASVPYLPHIQIDKYQTWGVLAGVAGIAGLASWYGVKKGWLPKAA